MKKIYQNRTLKVQQSIRYMLLLVLGIYLTSGRVWSQACPVLDGGTRTFRFSEANDYTFFPATIPAGKSGQSRATAGRLIMSTTKTVVYPVRTVTINPEFTDGTLGKAVLRFDILDMTPGAEIKVYSGLTATGIPTEIVNSANASSYLLQTRVYTGPVTVTFASPTPAASGDFNIRITYTTGDEVVTSAFGFSVAYWTNFITPNSYTVLENYPDETTPISTAYFNGTKQLVFSEVAFCIDYGQSAPSIGNNRYPGQMVFYPTVRTGDFNEDLTINTDDMLTAARMLHVISHAPQPISTFANFIAVRDAINSLSLNVNGNWAGLAGQAQAAIPSLPSPLEPDFSITGPATAVALGVAQDFIVNLTSDGGHAREFKLEIPSGVTINSVTGTGVTYNAVSRIITFAAAPASATVSVTSAVAANATLRLIYDQPNFWNLNNLLVYEPCDSYPKATNQGFLGIGKGENPKPFREASATWQSMDFDYGDLPNTYATTTASSGPSHAITGYNAATHTASLMLGSQIDSETDGVAGTVATGDDLAGVDDEDAVAKFPILIPGSTTYSITLPVTNTTGATATVKGWIDFNKDGVFGAGEDATQTVSNGGTSVTLSWAGFPAVANFGYLYARFRIASVASEIATPTGPANSGEVEDYRMFIGVTVAGTVFNDLNRNTRIDSGEPFTSLPAPMYVHMVQNNIIVDAATVAANGSYLLLAPAGQTSNLHLSAVQYAIGTDITVTPIDRTPPTGWATTGENGSGTNTGNGDFNPNGILQVSVGTANLTNRNFGITYKTAGTSKATDICASEPAVMPLAEFIDGEDAGGTWSQVSGSGITFDALAGTIQLTSSATTSTFRYDIPATATSPASFSIATVNVRPVPVTYRSITICQGESVCITNPAGTARVIEPQETICHTTSGVYSDTLSGATQFGCDSIVVTTLTVVPTPNAGTDGAVTACNNSTTPIDLFSLITGEQAGGTWERLTGTGGTFNAAAGTYTPAAGATSSTFSYTIAGAGSCPPDVSVATVTLQACTVQISGTVFNDANGLAGSPANTIDGTPIQSAGSSQLYANLFTAAGTFVASVPVDASGNYSFTVTPGTNYIVTVSSTAAINGSTPAGSVALPGGWINTGEFVGSGAGNDLTPNGMLSVNVGTSDVANANFGLDQEPNSNNVTHVLPTQPASNTEITLDGTGAPLMSGSDPEDGSYSGSAATPGNDPQGVVITSLPTNGELWYYGFNFPVRVSATDVSNGTLFPDPSLFAVILTGVGYTSTTFEYAYVDAAGAIDPTPATYTISWGTPLPVKLYNFNATAEGNTAMLKWATTSETNSKGFEIERSANASGWIKVGFVEAQSRGASTTSKMEYDFMDAQPLTGLNYYRLKMVDLDGTFAYSNIRSVHIDKPVQTLNAYPNPVVGGKLTVEVTGTGSYQAEVHSLSGVLVLQHNLGTARELNVSTLTSGMYILRVRSANGDVQTKTFVVK